MKQLEVQIMGQSYVLGCPPDGDAQLLDAVERLDTAMNHIRDAGKVRARDRIAVLAALNLTFDLVDPSKNIPRASPVTNESPSSNENPQLTAILNKLDHALSNGNRLL